MTHACRQRGHELSWAELGGIPGSEGQRQNMGLQGIQLEPGSGVCAGKTMKPLKYSSVEGLVWLRMMAISQRTVTCMSGEVRL